MTPVTTIYGASDDLIEVEGQISEEFSPGGPGGEPVILAFSDGTLLEVWYDRHGIWRIKSLVRGASEYTHEDGSVERDTPDRVTLQGVDLKWCVISDTGHYNPAFPTKKKSAA